METKENAHSLSRSPSNIAFSFFLGLPFFGRRFFSAKNDGGGGGVGLRQINACVLVNKLCPPPPPTAREETIDGSPLPPSVPPLWTAAASVYPPSSSLFSSVLVRRRLFASSPSFAGDPKLLFLTMPSSSSWSFVSARRVDGRIMGGSMWKIPLGVVQCNPLLPSPFPTLHSSPLGKEEKRRSCEGRRRP